MSAKAAAHVGADVGMLAVLGRSAVPARGAWPPTWRRRAPSDVSAVRRDLRPYRHVAARERHFSVGAQHAPGGRAVATRVVVTKR